MERIHRGVLSPRSGGDGQVGETGFPQSTDLGREEQTWPQQTEPVGVDEPDDVERPLRLRFEVTEDALAGLEVAKPLLKYDGRDKLLDALRPLVGQPAASSRAAFRGTLAAALAPLGKLPAPVDKAVWAAVSVSDPEGELQTDRAGAPLPDPDLRDNENVPLGETIDDYMAREVLPYVPDAWVDHSKTKIGYEIPFTRHFFVYTPPRPLVEIDAELKELEADVQRLLAEVTHG